MESVRDSLRSAHCMGVGENARHRSGSTVMFAVAVFAVAVPGIYIGDDNFEMFSFQVTSHWLLRTS